MALLPTDRYVAAYFEDLISPTREKNLFDNSVEVAVISDETSAAYTFTVGAVNLREIRPFNTIVLTVNPGHFTVNAVLTLSKFRRTTGDTVIFTFDPADTPSPRTITVKDDATSPATLFTVSNATSARKSYEFVLLSTGVWQLVRTT